MNLLGSIHKQQKILILISFFYRVLIFLCSKENPFITRKINSYTEMLDNYFLSFISYEHTKPILFFFKDYLAFKIYPYNYSLINLLIISVLDIISVLIYYQLILKISGNLKNSLIISILLSFSFVTWEYWREASHYDHLNIFLFAIFLHSNYLIFLKKRFTNYLYYTFSLIFISIMTSFGVIFALTSIVINFKIINKKVICIILSFLFSFYLIFVSGNIKNHGTPLLSTVGGQNLLQFVWNSNNAEAQIFQKLDNSNKYPSWYKNCFYEAFRENGKYGSIYGKCFPDPIKDNIELKKYLLNLSNNSKDKKLKSYVKKDLEVLDNPFHFAGGVGEVKLGFSVYYGKYSSKLARDVIIENPFVILNSLLRSVYSGLTSSLFFTGLYYESQLIKVPIFHKFFNFIISVFLFWGIVFSIIYSTLSLAKFILNNIHFKFKSYLYLKLKFFNSDYLLNYASFFVILNYFLFSITTCCENSRMLVGILPYCLLTTIGFLINIRDKKLNLLKS